MQAQHFYNVEDYLFSVVTTKFETTGQIDAIEFYAILDWKASRARTRHLRRLRLIAGNFEVAVQSICSELVTARSDEERLGFLITKWQFKLPTATAILTVLYPERFTIYDVRVCRALGGHDSLGSQRWSSTLWQHYQSFVRAVRQAAPNAKCLRECDQFVWGQDKEKVLRADLEKTK